MSTDNDNPKDPKPNPDAAPGEVPGGPAATPPTQEGRDAVREEGEEA